MASKTTSSKSAGPRRKRNSAAAWKKFAVVLSAPAAVVAAISLLGADRWSLLPFTVLIVAVAAAAVWLVARLLGVHLSLGSWD